LQMCLHCRSMPIRPLPSGSKRSSVVYTLELALVKINEIPKLTGLVMSTVIFGKYYPLLGNRGPVGLPGNMHTHIETNRNNLLAYL